MRISDWSSDVCSSDLVRAQTNDLPQIDRHVLRRIKFLPFARGNEQILPIWREGEAMGEMTVARILRNLPPNDFQVPDLCGFARSEEHTSELQSRLRTSYAVLCLNQKTIQVVVTRPQHMLDNTTNQSY